MNDALRGDPSKLRQSLPYDKGYFGALFNIDDQDLIAHDLATEVFNVAGHMRLLIPVIVPTLNRQELIHLVDGGRPTWGMIEQAKRHAEQRIAVGASPFAQPGEQHKLPAA